MDNSHLLRAPGLASAGKLKQQQDARTMMKVIRERANKLGVNAPAYNLLELIGKGTYGRVYKSQQQGRKGLVAVKIMDIDQSDFDVDVRAKDAAIKDFTQEIQILSSLKEGNAKNVNVIYDAFSFHSQLWIVSEYCPGGSVHTLMKASLKPGLEEKYIVAICRELAIAMKCVHDAKIIHRDIKAGNILITQDGQLQLCDFGVSGILENSVAKRTTIIGTPQWMAPELLGGIEVGYGTEVDCWAYGCTVFELATGQPPNSRVHPDHIHKFLQTAPKLLGDEHSPALKEFVAFCLEVRSHARPTADSILKHPFIFNTSKRYPTIMLKELITRYSQWEQSGGQRASLFMAHGALAPTMLKDNEDDDWNFSTFDEADQEYADSFESPPRIDHRKRSSSNESTPRQNYGSVRGKTPFEQAKDEFKAQRGAAKMEAIFNENLAPYEYSTEDPEDSQMSDLPLRNMSIGGATRESVIDLDAAFDMGDVPTLDLPDMTVKAVKNRFYAEDEEEGYMTPNQALAPVQMNPGPFVAIPRIKPQLQNRSQDLSVPMARSATEGMRPKTQEWSFSEAQSELKASASRFAEARFPEAVAPGPSHAAPFRPALKHTVTEPLGNFGDYLHPTPAPLELERSPRSSMIDIDELYHGEPTRPSTAISSAGNSVITDFTSDNPFYLEDDRVVMPPSMAQRNADIRSSFHLHSQSEPVTSDRSSNGALLAVKVGHHRGQSSFSASDSEWNDRQRISVQASIDSLRQRISDDAAIEDHADRNDYLQMRRSPPQAQSSRQFERAPVGTSSQTVRPALEPSAMEEEDEMIDLDAAMVGNGRKYSIASSSNLGGLSDFSDFSPPNRSRPSHSRDRTNGSDASSYHHGQYRNGPGCGPRERSDTVSTTASQHATFQLGPGIPKYPTASTNGMSGLHSANNSFGGYIHHSPATSSFSSTTSASYGTYPAVPVETAGLPIQTAQTVSTPTHQQDQSTPVPTSRRQWRDRPDPYANAVNTSDQAPATHAYTVSAATSFTSTVPSTKQSGSFSTASHGTNNSVTILTPISTTSTSNPSNSRLNSVAAHTSNLHHPSANTISFPQPLPPDAAALEEDADLNVVIAEGERLLDDLLAGMKAARLVLRNWGAGVGVPV